MKEETKKQTWETPEMIDLDMDETTGPKVSWIFELNSSTGPGSS